MGAVSSRLQPILSPPWSLTIKTIGTLPPPSSHTATQCLAYAVVYKVCPAVIRVILYRNVSQLPPPPLDYTQDIRSSCCRACCTFLFCICHCVDFSISSNWNNKTRFGNIRSEPQRCSMCTSPHLLNIRHLCGMVLRRFLPDK